MADKRSIPFAASIDQPSSFAGVRYSFILILQLERIYDLRFLPFLSTATKDMSQMVDKYFFLLGLANNILLILIFLIRKNHLAFVESYGWVYLLLAAPAAYVIFLVQREQKGMQYTIFLAIFLAFLALEALYDFILKIPFRDNWKLLTPYLLLYYAMNYGFVVMVWKNSLEKGLILLALFVVQLVTNIMTH